MKETVPSMLEKVKVEHPFAKAAQRIDQSTIGKVGTVVIAPSKLGKMKAVHPIVKAVNILIYRAWG